MRGNLFSKTMALFLSFVMVFSVTQVAAFAEQPEFNSEIVAFASLSEDVAAQTVDYGTDISELRLPHTLSAGIRFAPGNDLPDETEDVSDVQEIREELQWEEVPVSWQAYPAYDSYAPGVYTFMADTVSYGFIVTTTPPIITVTVMGDEPKLINENEATINYSSDTKVSGSNLGMGFFVTIDPNDPLPPNATPISTAAELAGIGSGVVGSYYYLTNDIYLDTEWTPIINFVGTLDGRGKTINNLYCETDTLSGLIGSIIGKATIKNLGVNIGVQGVHLKNSYNDDWGDAGGLVANVSGNLTIENCFVNGNVSSSAQSANVGGLVGSLQMASSLTIKLSYTTGEIKAIDTVGIMSPTYMRSDVYAGGLVGFIQFNTSFTIESCYTLGKIHAEAVNGNACAAGLVGYVHYARALAQFSVKNNYVEGDIFAYSHQRDSDNGAGQRHRYEELCGDLISVDLINSGPQGLSNVVENNYHHVSQVRTVKYEETEAWLNPPLNCNINCSHVTVLGQPAADFSLVDFSFVTLDISSFTNQKTLLVSGEVFGIDIQKIEIYNGSDLLKEVSGISISGKQYSDSVELPSEGVHKLRAKIVSGGKEFYSNVATVSYDEAYVGLKEFFAYFTNNKTDLLRDDQLDIIWFGSNHPVTFELLILTSNNQTITEVYVVADTGVKFPAVPMDNGKWMAIDWNPNVYNYIPGKMHVEAVINTDMSGSVGSLFDGTTGTYGDSILMPNNENQPGYTTSAYIVHTGAMGSGTWINPNESLTELVAGQLSVFSYGGNNPWDIIATHAAVGKTYVFWAQGGGNKEYIILKINAPGTYKVGIQRAGLQHLNYVGATMEYEIIRKIIGEGRYRLVIDPSGIVYEAVPSNALKGVTATVYKQGESNPWDATVYEQENPLTTNDIGYYRWDVPEGWWQVKYEKAGYEPAESIWMPVPPEHTEVHVGMVSKSAPNVTHVNGYPTGIEVYFDKYMNPIESFTVMQDGIEIPGKNVLMNRESNYLPLNYMGGTIPTDVPDNEKFPGEVTDVRVYASVLRFEPEPGQVLSGSDIQLTIDGSVTSYADIPMGSDFQANINIVSEPKTISADNLKLALDEMDSITVTVDPADAAFGKNITAVSDNPLLVEVNSSEPVNGSGQAVFNVKGLMPGTTSITFSLEGTLLTAQSAVSVDMPLSVREQLGYTEAYLTSVGFPPENNSIAPTITSDDNHEVMSGIFGQFQVSATGNPPPTFRLNNPPVGVSINPSTGLLSIAGTTAIGSHSFTITASNAELSDFVQSFTLDITPLHHTDPTPSPTPTPTSTPKQATEDFITRLYKNVFDRDPDEEGFEFWVNGLLSGQETAASVADHFFFSKEFLADEISNEQYLTIAYNTFLGREPEEEGFDFWLNTLESGFNRRYVMDELIMSLEYKDICAAYGIELGPVAGVEGFVVRMYRNVLESRYDTEGLAFWVNGLLNNDEDGASIAEKFFFDPAFLEREVSNEKYIAIAYQTFMNRDPEPGGLEHWMNALESGEDRRAVLGWMIDCDEFKAICARYGIEPGALS